MERCLIFCAGGFDRLLTPIEDGDKIIAADGGYLHTQKLGVKANILLGDFDSLGYCPDGAEVFPVEKDDTDAMLAVKKALELGCREIHIYGGMDGDRPDHTLANYQTLGYLARHGARGYLIGLSHIATVISGETVQFSSDAEGILSLFCLGSDAGGITLTGLKYNMENGTLTSDFPLGVSNHFTGSAATVTVKSGWVLALWERRSGLPTRL